MKLRSKSESVAWFPELDAETAMKVDQALQGVTHDLLRGLIDAFPGIDQDGLTAAVGKAEKVLAGAIASLISPAQSDAGSDDSDSDSEYSDDDFDSGDTDGDFGDSDFGDPDVGESLARRLIKQCRACG